MTDLLDGRPFRILCGDAVTVLRTLPAGLARTCVTSPPYWRQRDYIANGQLGHEATPELFVAALVDVFREVRRVLADDGTLWVNIGDTYATRWGSIRAEGRAGLADNDRFRGGRVPAGHKEKDLIGIPWALAFALKADGWWLRSDVIWAKPSPEPESVKDRPARSHEHLFLLSKRQDYFYDVDATREPHVTTREKKHGRGAMRGQREMKCTGKTDRADRWYHPLGRNLRDVWNVAPVSFPGEHFATFPPSLIEPCIKAGCPEGGIVLDPFSGAGTTALVATRLRRRALGIELNPDYVAMSERRIRGDAPLFHGAA